MKGEGLMTHGPTFRPTDWPDLKRDPLALENLPSRYTPGPARVPMDRSLKDQRSDVPREAKPEPRRDNLGASGYTRIARERSATHLGARQVHPNSIAGRVIAVLAESGNWMSAHEVYLRIREMGRHHAGEGFGAVTKGSDVPRAIAWHVTTGRILTQVCTRPEAAANHGRASKEGFLEYRLSKLTEEQSS